LKTSRMARWRWRFSLRGLRTGLKTQTLVTRAMFANQHHFSASEGFPFVPREPRFGDKVKEVLTIRGIYIAVVTVAFCSNVTRHRTLGVDDTMALMRYSTDPSQRLASIEDSNWLDRHMAETSFMNTSWVQSRLTQGT
jgi:hypothetical protein